MLSCLDASLIPSDSPCRREITGSFRGEQMQKNILGNSTNEHQIKFIELLGAEAVHLANVL